MTFLEKEQSEQRRRIALRVRHLREQVKMNQTALANKLGLRNAQAISELENGEREVTTEELVALRACEKSPVQGEVIGVERLGWINEQRTRVI